jgi:predicted small secreted protein
MKRTVYFLIVLSFMILTGCNTGNKTGKDRTATDGEFPPELVNVKLSRQDSLFSGTYASTWDSLIRERGFILKEDGIYKMWYSGYNPDRLDEIHLGYATSKDGVHWERYPDNPIYDDGWVEDMCVWHEGDTYYMFAEGRNDVAHMLTSSDGIHWQEKGALDIRKTTGDTVPGPYGTPTVWKEKDTWYLFYERNDLGIWLATSTDLKVWKNVSDDPVIAMGPEPFDKYAVAMDQVIKYKGRYYGYYHANTDDPWTRKGWNSCVAVSTDLVHWKKYPGNPLVNDGRDSPIVVWDGEQFRLYTMHPAVYLYLPEKK